MNPLTIEQILQKYHGHQVEVKTPGIVVVGRLNYQPKSVEKETGHEAQSCVDFVDKEGGGMAVVEFTIDEVINIEINCKDGESKPPTIWLKYD